MGSAFSASWLCREVCPADSDEEIGENVITIEPNSMASHRTRREFGLISDPAHSEDVCVDGAGPDSRLRIPRRASARIDEPPSSGIDEIRLSLSLSVQEPPSNSSDDRRLFSAEPSEESSITAAPPSPISGCGFSLSDFLRYFRNSCARKRLQAEDSPTSPFIYRDLPPSGTGTGCLYLVGDIGALTDDGCSNPLAEFRCERPVLLYSGEFRQFLPHGRGREFNPFASVREPPTPGRRLTGVAYYGCWKRGYRHGLGLVIQKNAERILGEWRDGQLSEVIVLDPGLDLSQEVRSIRSELRRLWLDPKTSLRGMHKIFCGGESGCLFKIRLRWENEFQFFAFKYMRGESPNLIDDMMLEVSLMLRVQHHNVVRGLGYSLNPNGIVMEMLWKDVATLIEHEDLSFEDKLKIAWDVAAGCLHLHNRHVLHLDLKLSNVMITKPLSQPDWRAVLIDFGLSRFHKSYRLTKKKRSVVGTAGKIAPEVYQSGEFSCASDVFAYGILLFELFSGGRAFAKSGVQRRNSPLNRTVARGFRPDLSRLNLGPDHRWILHLMKACWAPSPERRPTFRGIRALLSNHIQRRKSPALLTRKSRRLPPPARLKEVASSSTSPAPFAGCSVGRLVVPPATNWDLNSLTASDCSFLERTAGSHPSLWSTESEGTVWGSESFTTSGFSDVTIGEHPTLGSSEDRDYSYDFAAFSPVKSSFTRVTFYYRGINAHVIFGGGEDGIDDLILSAMDLSEIILANAAGDSFDDEPTISYRLMYDRPGHRREEFFHVDVRLLSKEGELFKNCVFRLMDARPEMEKRLREGRVDRGPELPRLPDSRRRRN